VRTSKEVFVCLRKSPFRSPALLAANRANSLKSTGPRTPQGKARSSLNALEHGDYACRLPERLRAAGYGERAALHQTAYQEICGAFRPEGPAERAQAVRLANNVVAMAEQAGVFGTKPECPLFSARLGPRFHSLFPIRVDDPWRGIGLVFWVQRKGYWTLPKLLRSVFGETQDASRRGSVFGFRGSALTDAAGTSRSPNPKPRTPEVREPPLRLALECRVRHRVYRMRRLTAGERVRYGLNTSRSPADSNAVDSSRSERDGNDKVRTCGDESVDSRLRGSDRLRPRPLSELERVEAMIRAAKLMPHERY